MQHYPLADERQTDRWGRALAVALSEQSLGKQAFVITLQGDLGAGKTTLVRSILQKLGVEERIKSPTFALVEFYNPSNYPAYHFDLYRFSSPEQWFDAGFDDIFAGPGLMLVEWPDKARGAMPAADLDIQIQLTGQEDAREIVAHALSTPGQQCLNRLATILASDDDAS
ncbi:MAG: tRNA (adenosine(37)-N6)-threonylcarbamoyltransferase complex ATPase subunit type 1 TsaE [Lautropia sp.]|nr:tRNA (adenosine(37)-N6)-threonylcarbamoyltransferase complex ATPase subunit type 1 TsaE [Lautropia sp.]